MGTLRAKFTVAVLAAFWAASAQASPIAQDSFLVGNPALPFNGEYAVGDIASGPGLYQNPTVAGFTGAWGGNTGTIEAVSAGLDYPGLLTRGGAIRYRHTANLADYPRAATRAISTYDLDQTEYYVAGLMSFESSFQTATNSTAFTGFLSTYPESTTTTLGMQWGFQGNGAGGVDAVVRLRDAAAPNHLSTHVVSSGISPGTHLFIMKVEPKASGTDDPVSVWFDPASFSTEAAAGAPQMFSTAAWVPGSVTHKVDTLMFNEFSVGANTSIHYDEVRFGSAWEDIHLDGSQKYVRFQEGVDGYEHLGAELREGIPTSNLGTPDQMVTGYNPGGGLDRMRAVLAFDLEGVPGGVDITDVNLTLSVKSHATATGVQDVELWLVEHATSTMDEGEVTWTRARSGENWATPGGDFTVLLGTIPGFTDTDRKTFLATPEFLAATKAAADSGKPLELLLMSPLTEAGGARAFVRWYSDDAALGNRPVLTVSFAIPEPATWGLFAFGGTLLLVWRRRSRIPTHR